MIIGDMIITLNNKSLKPHKHTHITPHNTKPNNRMAGRNENYLVIVSSCDRPDFVLPSSASPSSSAPGLPEAENSSVRNLTGYL
jgi:hypothetical protein